MIDIAAPPLGGGQISGVVVSSVSSTLGSCSESFRYSYPGNGEAPQVTVEKSGNACPSGPSIGAGGNPAVVSPMPAVRPNAPRVIEASAAPQTLSPSAQKAFVQRVAELIKAAPAS